MHLRFKEHIVPESRVFSVRPMGSYKQNLTIHEVHFVNLSALALGFKRELEGHHNDLYTDLCSQYKNCREAFLQRTSTENLPLLYAQMHRIATEFCTLVRFMKQSVSLICPNSIERRYRELMLFGVIISDAQTREACLQQMIPFKK